MTELLEGLLVQQSDIIAEQQEVVRQQQELLQQLLGNIRSLTERYESNS